MRKINLFCLSLLGLTGSVLSANPSNNNDLLNSKAKEKELIASIEFLELEDESALGTELLKYLPEDFDPYKGMLFDPSEIKFEEIDQPEDFDFDTKLYLPENFNPYSGQ